MGGYTSVSSAASVQASNESQAKSLLQQFFREQDSRILVRVYDLFAKNVEKEGFISWMLRAQDRNGLPKEFQIAEFETKLNLAVEQVMMMVKEPGLGSYLDCFDFKEKFQDRYVRERRHAVSVGKNHFFGRGSEESLVIIEKGGKWYSKEKSGELPFQGAVSDGFSVLKRDEFRKEVTLDALLAKVAEVAGGGAVYYGYLVKEKAEDFVLDMADGRVYSFIVSRATHERKEGKPVQRQLEIEYAGYIPGFRGHGLNSQVQIATGILDLTKRIVKEYGDSMIGSGWRMRVTPTTERKYDFIRGEKSSGIPRLIEME